MPNNFDYDAYRREYCKKHPEKVLQWRFRTYWKFCQKYMRENPESACELMRQVNEGR